MQLVLFTVLAGSQGSLWWNTPQSDPIVLGNAKNIIQAGCLKHSTNFCQCSRDWLVSNAETRLSSQRDFSYWKSKFGELLSKDVVKYIDTEPSPYAVLKLLTEPNRDAGIQYRFFNECVNTQNIQTGKNMEIINAFLDI